MRSMMRPSAGMRASLGPVRRLRMFASDHSRPSEFSWQVVHTEFGNRDLAASGLHDITQARDGDVAIVVAM